MSSDYDLKEDLRRGMRNSGSMHKIYNLTSHLMFWAGIVATIVGTGLQILIKDRRPLLVVSSAVIIALGPLLVSSRRMLDRSANWHKLRQLAAHGLLAQLSYEGAARVEVSKRWREFELEHELGWQMGSPTRLRMDLPTKAPQVFSRETSNDPQLWLDDELVVRESQPVPTMQEDESVDLAVIDDRARLHVPPLPPPAMAAKRSG